MECFWDRMLGHACVDFGTPVNVGPASGHVCLDFGKSVDVGLAFVI